MRNETEFKRDPRDAVIPTPEEEALEDFCKASNARSNRALFALFLMFGSFWFSNDISDAAQTVWRLFT